MKNPIGNQVVNFSQKANNDIEQVAKCEYAKIIPPQGMMRPKQVLDFVPFSRTTLHEWSDGVRFPKPIKLSPTMVAYKNQEVIAWLESHSLASDDVEGV
ncbi:helix-turn-helix transcriptional regulator [Psychrobacter urativorans]|uniref:helix-turn-helix transcriptional regulator n=1 Tax=Psychrobacter urativorans TaxID=45610 RepID=UPI00191A2C0D|nr:AlpA family phage regulatory protein [Psychrobacter urativorans]